MSELSEDVALRIGLAARALPELDLQALLLGLISLVGEPLTGPKLNKLRLGKFKSLSAFEGVDEHCLKEALGYLRGRNIEREPEPMPEVHPYREGEMPNSIRVACASNEGEKVNAHFGSCARFLIYQLCADEARLIEIRSANATSVEPEVADEQAADSVEKAIELPDKNALRAALINDCQVLYTVSIGGPAAAKVVRAGVHPIKLPHGGDAPEVLQRLRETLAGTPPPWLAKVMGVEPEERVRFREEASG